MRYYEYMIAEGKKDMSKKFEVINQPAELRTYKHPRVVQVTYVTEGGHKRRVSLDGDEVLLEGWSGEMNGYSHTDGRVPLEILRVFLAEVDKV